MGANERVDETVARSKWREKIAGEKRAGSRPGAGLLSLTEVPNTCGITGAGQVHRWRRKTKVFSTREPQDGILLRATDTTGQTLGWKIFYCSRSYPVFSHPFFLSLFVSFCAVVLDNTGLVFRIYDRSDLSRILAANFELASTSQPFRSRVAFFVVFMVFSL